MSEWVTSLQVNRWWLWYAKTHLSAPESRSILMTSWGGKFCVRVFLRHWSVSTSPITFSYIPLSPWSTHPPFSPPVLYAWMLYARMYKNTYMLWYSTQTLGKNILCRNMIRHDMTDGSCWLLKRRGQIWGMLEWGGGGGYPQVSNFQTELLLVKRPIYVKSLFWNTQQAFGVHSWARVQTQVTRRLKGKEYLLWPYMKSPTCMDIIIVTVIFSLLRFNLFLWTYNMKRE